MTFAELQAAFQRAIMIGEDAVLGLIPDGAREKKNVLLGVYRNAYVLRLVEVLQNDHELLRAYLGDDAFAEMARAYVAAHPSDQPNARWFSRHLPSFLAKTAPYSANSQLAELALLEKTLSDAFDAADAPVVGVPDLAAIPPDEWERLAFTPHPSATRLDFETNATGIWAALKAETDPPEVTEQAPSEKILVWRGETPMFRVLGSEEAMMWDEAAKGVRFGVLCEMLATYNDPDGAPARAAQYLAGWLVSGAISRVAAPDAGKTRKRRAAKSRF